MIGEDPRSAAVPEDPSIADVFIPHPVHGSQGWVAVVNPGHATSEAAVALLRAAHESARRRADRHVESAAS